MSTIEIIRTDAAAFMRKYGLENENTIAVCKLANDSEGYLGEDEENSMILSMWQACLTMRTAMADLELS